MTREEQIERALNFYAPSYWDDISQVMSNRELTASYCGFRKGVEWADKHPINISHNTSEEPKIDSNMIGIEKESELYAQGVVGELSEDVRHLLETAYIAGAKRIMK